MSRCKNCIHKKCPAYHECIETCSMYDDTLPNGCCKCVAANFDGNEDCPYYEEVNNDTRRKN